jgi:nucleoid DNA-binding protein
MQNLIADYLLENKQCFIPSLGILGIKKSTALYNFSEQTMEAPKPSIFFEEKEIENDSLAKFIAAKKNISIADADNLIADFSASVNFLLENEKMDLNGLGCFCKKANGKLEFEPANLNAAFFPTVQAVKVVHPNATHVMKVGDTETDTATMTEYFAEETPVKEKWWVWAAVFSVLSIGALAYFIFGTSHKNIGNIFPVEKINAEKTFTLPK